MPLTDSGPKTAGIVVGSVPRCTPAKVRTCDLCVRKTADTNIRDVTDDTSIYRPSAYLEAARTGVGRIGGDPEVYVRPFPCPPVGSVAAAARVECIMRNACGIGVSAGNAGRGCGRDLCPQAFRHGVGPAPSGKGSRRSRARLRRLAALTGQDFAGPAGVLSSS